jgi:predicted TIM-barrel fold metal-dependent hydrolase
MEGWGMTEPKLISADSHVNEPGDLWVERIDSSAENEVGWLPFFLQKLDQAQDEYRYLYPAPLKLKPIEYFRRQIFATFIDDPVGVATREFIGVNNIMWSSDYPHTVSTWPHSREVIERDFKGVPESEKRQIVCENVARLYGLALA